MKYKIEFLKEANNDIINAVGYYEKQQKGLGERFKNTLNERVNYLTNYPKHFRIIEKEYRQILIKPFPYLVIYKIIKDKILVYKVFNTSKNPKQKYK